MVKKIPDALYIIFFQYIDTAQMVLKLKTDGYLKYCKIMFMLFIFMTYDIYTIVHYLRKNIYFYTNCAGIFFIV